MAQHEEEIPSVKDLASSDPALRRRALTSISTHLATRTTPLTPTQALQLQKGFFFALYMHDSRSPLSVQSLVATLAGLTVSGSAATNSKASVAQTQSTVAVALPLTEAFWSSMAREWTNIDAHRMDKYLLLVRMVVREIFTSIFLSAKNPNSHGVGSLPPSESDESQAGVGASKQIALLATWPLSPRDRKVPDGLRYHVLDIYVDELERALTTTKEALNTEADEDKVEGEEDLSEETQHAIERLLAPVEVVAKEGLSKGVRIRAKETLGDERVVRWRTRTRAKGEGTVGGERGGNGEAKNQELGISERK